MFLARALLDIRSITAWFVHIAASMGGCHTKPKLITSIDEPLKGQKFQKKGLKLQGRTVSKPGTSDDFWTTSTCEMDNSAVQSRGSISSISTSNQNQTIDLHGANSVKMPSEFVNNGLLLWNQTRQQWVGNKRPENRAQQLREPKISWNATYEGLLGSSKPFSQPVPLCEMVDFLVDVWEQEGMYD
ncbi:uncharacterized protein LOC132283014 [Cornus florida]|uniref:uncharacterized protein LOC132283014 n=1 Tax=Cornus florida TaxID=4283 RepID=UPI002898B43F|nr:uncharacterized protein LOC132283014 [Cornus florida]